MYTVQIKKTKYFFGYYSFYWENCNTFKCSFPRTLMNIPTQYGTVTAVRTVYID